jgi:tRNA threonylcarbamoyladenosine biosynthesis protein TsaB
MIVLLDTSTPLCKIMLVDGDTHYQDEWQADRQLAKGLLGYIHDQLETQGKSWQDITGLGVFEGPGSFTGLRIGLTVMNTIASSEQVPIVGGRGESWQSDVLAKLAAGTDEHIVLPFYGSEPHITQARK